MCCHGDLNALRQAEFGLQHVIKVSILFFRFYKNYIYYKFQRAAQMLNI